MADRERGCHPKKVDPLRLISFPHQILESTFNNTNSLTTIGPSVRILEIFGIEE